ncbi:unnamed protein product, partial [Leptidea sinapis]
KSENLVNVLTQIFKVVYCPLKESDIDGISRVRKMSDLSSPNNTRPRSIVLKLSSTKHRDIVIAAVANYNKNNKENKLSISITKLSINSKSIGYGGPVSAIYISEHLSPYYKKLHSQTRILARERGFKQISWESDNEDLWITLKVRTDTNSRFINICGVYLPPPLTIPQLDNFLDRGKVSCPEEPLSKIDIHHPPLLINFDIVCHSNLKAVPFATYSFRKADYDYVITELDKVDWQTKNPRDLFEYKILKDRVDKLMPTCYKQYIRDIESGIHGNPRRFWSFVKNHKSSSSSLPSKMSYNNMTADTGEDIVNLFAVLVKYTLRYLNSPTPIVNSRDALLKASGVMMTRTIGFIEDIIQETGRRAVRSSGSEEVCTSLCAVCTVFCRIEIPKQMFVSPDTEHWFDFPVKLALHGAVLIAHHDAFTRWVVLVPKMITN